MIVLQTDKNYGSDETCEGCDAVIYTDGAYEVHACPLCDTLVLPCNICPDHSKCDDCPVKTKTTKHTPGPWKTISTNTNLFHIGSDSTRVCLIADLGNETEEDKANAHLIAKAPETAQERDELKELNADMLEGLRFIQKALACWRDEEDIIHPIHGKLNLEEVKYYIVDDLITKAEGGK